MPRTACDYIKTLLWMTVSEYVSRIKTSTKLSVLWFYVFKDTMNTLEQFHSSKYAFSTLCSNFGMSCSNSLFTFLALKIYCENILMGSKKKHYKIVLTCSL